MKQVIVLRKDLKLGKGKWCSQAAHAAVMAAYYVSVNNKKIYLEWIIKGQTKIVLAVTSEKELLELKSAADRLKVSNTLIRDAAHTQLHEPTFTALGIGPDIDEKINQLTGHLKLF